MPHLHVRQMKKEERSKQGQTNISMYIIKKFKCTLLLAYKVCQFIECLEEMAVQNENDDDDFLAYTRQRTDQINRSGLFPLNHGTF